MKKMSLWFGVAAIATVIGAGSAQAQINNVNGTVTCTTITKGVIKPKPTLTNAGGFPTAIAISGVLGGCTTNVPGVTLPEGKSKFKGVLNSANNNCAGLVGPSPSTGTITITWGTVPAVTNKVSVVTIPAGGSSGNVAVVAGSARGTFDLGAPVAAALSVTGGFTGAGGTGALSNAQVVTQESATSLGVGCGDPKGLKLINIGAGSISLQ